MPKHQELTIRLKRRGDELLVEIWLDGTRYVYIADSTERDGVDATRAMLDQFLESPIHA